MIGITLPFAITDMNGHELIEQGGEISAELFTELARKGLQHGHQMDCLMRQGIIQTDLEYFMRSDAYAHIFGGQAGIKGLLSRIEEVPVPRPLIQALETLKQHDFITYQHSLIVFALTALLLEVSADKETAGEKALLIGPTHDLGKLYIPEAILGKKTPLRSDERQLLEFHTIAGYALLCYYLGDHLHPAALCALNHHERRDGSGYPRGLIEIDPLVEMVSICDVYDALISPRPYRDNCYDNRTALEELSDLADQGAMNWCYIQALIGRNRAGHPAPEEVEISADRRGAPPTNNCHGRLSDT